MALSTGDTVALASSIGTCIGAVIAVPSVLYARMAAKASRDAADTGQESAEAAKASAEAANRSADEAAALNRIEAERREEERERWHADREPTSPGVLEAKLKKGTPADSLMGTIKVGRAYRVRMQAVFGTGGKTDIGPFLLQPNQETTFEIEMWAPGQKAPKTSEIIIYFWPPFDVDGVGAWSCPCGRPTGEERGGMNPSPGCGHWEWRLPVIRKSGGGGLIA
jgi:hypothetical protein